MNQPTPATSPPGPPRPPGQPRNLTSTVEQVVPGSPKPTPGPGVAEIVELADKEAQVERLNATLESERGKEVSAWSPQPKIGAAGASGALTVVLVWVAGEMGLTMPPEIAASVAALIAMTAGYLVPDK